MFWSPITLLVISLPLFFFLKPGDRRKIINKKNGYLEEENNTFIELSSSLFFTFHQIYFTMEIIGKAFASSVERQWMVLYCHTAITLAEGAVLPLY